MDQSKNVDHNQAMEMLNSALREMKEELNKVDAMSLKGPKEKLAKHMHKIYDDMSELVETYEHSHLHEDLNCAFRQLEILKPAFILNYGEILS